MPGAIDISDVPITVVMPFTFDINGIEAELFGEEYELSGTIIDVMTKISASAFYSEGLNAGWLNYIQAEDENDFEVYVDQFKAAQVLDTIKLATNYTPGQTYDPANSGSQVIDASGIFDSGATWNYYNSVHDFIISWFAYKILGHPGALAAISNDSHIRSTYTTRFDTSIEAIKGADGCVIADVTTLADRTLATVEAAVIQSGQPSNGMPQADLQFIVQQVMNLAPGRFTEVVDRGYLAPVRWYEDDVICMQLSLSDCSFSVAAIAPTGTSTRTPDARGAGVYKSNASGGQILTDNYILRFTMTA
jgi:hypothetical protein